MQLYQNHSSYPKIDAQRNLCGRTHYVDDETLRWHKSRIIATRVTDKGLLYAIITSDALDMHNTKRGFRYVIFDLFGTVLARPELEQAFRTSQQASKAMWAELNKINAKEITLAAIEKSRNDYANELKRLTETVDALDGK